MFLQDIFRFYETSHFDKISFGLCDDSHRLRCSRRPENEHMALHRMPEEGNIICVNKGVARLPVRGMHKPQL